MKGTLKLLAVLVDSEEVIQAEAVVLGLREAEFVSTPSFVDKSIQFRNILPQGYEHFVVIGVDSAGNPVGFQYPNKEIVIVDFDFGGKMF
ncbi:hypothetical protein ACEWPB_15685 [Priestia megaterium]|uniref:hypothetical protein n=1 Tax=Priestia megaterium TaxID=1404 RepID=UPI0035CC0A03